MKKDYCKMFNILDRYLKDKVQDIDFTILEAVKARKDGKIFSFEEHLKGFIYAQLSALVSWKKIKENQIKFNELFCNFDCKTLKEQSADFLIDEIKKLKCYSPYTTKNQMLSLKTNIETFEKIKQEYGGLEKFVTHTTPVNIVKLLADNNSVYKLKYSGVALVCEYLRNVGIDIIKPDIHIKRILGTERLNILKSKSDYAVIAECKKLSDKIGISQVKIDYLLWNYCSKGYGEVCSATPKCEKCVIKNYCNKVTNNKKIIIKKQVVSTNTDQSKIDFYKMDKGTIRNYSEQIAAEKLCKRGYRFINISTGREKSLYRTVGNKENALVRFMFYRFNPSVKNNYAWIRKENFNDVEYDYLIFVLYVANSAHVLFIPARDVTCKFESRDYDKGKSAPEWGIHLDYRIIKQLITHYEIT